MQTEFIEAIIDGTIKVADIDPSLQWGLVGGGVGALGSALKSVAADESLGEGLRRAALTGLLGAGVGTGLSAGARLLGAKPTTPVEAVSSAPKNPPPSVAASAGVGALGAAGLGGLSEARQLYFRNKAIGDFMFSGDDSALGDTPVREKGKAPQPSERQAAIREILEKVRGAPQGQPSATPHRDLPGFFNQLLGRTEHGEKGLSALREGIQSAERAGNPRATMLRGILKDVLQGDKIMKLAPAERQYLDPFLRSMRSPKGLLAAGAGLGLTHLGLSNLVHKMREKR